MASYYFDQTLGNDTTGTGTILLPWKTIAKHNGRTFSAGDIIYFKRGEVWDERLSPPSSGALGNRITYTAYGSGALPTIRAATGRYECVSIGNGKDHLLFSLLNMVWDVQGTNSSASGLFENGDGQDIVIEDCTFDGKHTADNCVGQGNDAHTIIRRCTITNAFDDGITLHATASFLVEECTFTGNRSAINNSSSSAMAMTVNDCIFEENGGGVSSSEGDVNGLSTGAFVFNRCWFKGRADGGGIGYMTNGTGTNVTCNQCIFDNHHSTSLSNGSINHNGTASTGVSTFNNCIFIGPVSPTSARGSISVDAGQTMTMNNCIIYRWWRVGVAGGGTFTLNKCLLYQVTQTNNLTQNNPITPADPLFTSVTGEDFHLLVGSPAIDAASDLGFTTDFDGNAMPAGAGPDLGPYEYGSVPEATEEQTAVDTGEPEPEPAGPASGYITGRAVLSGGAKVM